MSGTEVVEVAVAKSFCVRLAVALDIVRIHRLCARRVNVMMLVRIEMIAVRDETGDPNELEGLLTRGGGNVDYHNSIGVIEKRSACHEILLRPPRHCLGYLLNTSALRQESKRYDAGEDRDDSRGGVRMSVPPPFEAGCSLVRSRLLYHS